MADIDPFKNLAEDVATAAPRPHRDNLFLSATIRRLGEAEEGLVPVRIRNLSPEGMMADFTEVAEPGDPVVVTVRGIGSVAGKVAWIRRGRIGVTFDVEVDPQMARKPVTPAPQPLSKPLRPIF